MQVGILSAAPLPGSVKVARRPVKPIVLVRVQVWQPFSGCNVSSRRPCSERGGRRCNSCHPDHFGRQADTSWLHLSRKQDRHEPRSEHYRRLPPVFFVSEKNCRAEARSAQAGQFLDHQPLTLNYQLIMKPVIRYQSQLLFRRSYKPGRVIRIRPVPKVRLVFRPAQRFGAKPQLEIVP